MTCNRCGDECGDCQTFLSKGTGYCDQCATARMQVEMTKPEARLWVIEWSAEMTALVLMLAQQNGERPHIYRRGSVRVAG